MAVSDVYRTLWRHRYFVLLVTALVVGAAFVFTSRKTELYTASSLVRVQQNVRTAQEVFGALLTGERLARTYESIAETGSVRQLVKKELGRSVSTDTVVIKAAQVSNLELLRIDATDPNPKVAAAVANAVPHALAQFTEKTGTSRDEITVIERASTPAAPSSPNLRLNLVIAFLLGLILACGLALLREGLSDRIEDVEELERVSGHPVVAVIPNLKFQPASAPALRRSRDRDNVDSASRTKVTKIEVPESTEPASRWSARG